MKISVLLAITATSLGVQANASLTVADNQLSHIEGYSLTDVKTVILRAGGHGPTYLKEYESAVVEILRHSKGLGHVNPERIDEPQLKEAFIFHQRQTSPN